MIYFQPEEIDGLGETLLDAILKSAGTSAQAAFKDVKGSDILNKYLPTVKGPTIPGADRLIAVGKGIVTGVKNFQAKQKAAGNQAPPTPSISTITKEPLPSPSGPGLLTYVAVGVGGLAVLLLALRRR